ncbi:MAG: cellulase family glycosylhydrolase [Candidatus Omnitrophica bacterium]|nr:cellulase family glycosylhydrolase [Candidatus Omnitrophota bacterium]
MPDHVNEAPSGLPEHIGIPLDKHVGVREKPGVPLGRNPRHLHPRPEGRGFKRRDRWPFRLRGVNLGGWLLMEGYLLAGRNIAVKEIKSQFKKQYGPQELEKFEKAFRTNFITEDDFKTISRWGANCIRVPFHYRLLEKGPFRQNTQGIRLLGKVLDWAGNHGLKVILDLHAAPGAQNHDWHADSTGEALFWQDVSLRERCLEIWECIVDQLKDKPALYGYDVLNEPVLDKREIPQLTRFYSRLIRSIKSIDKDHTIFLEGNLWATQIDFLKDLIAERVAISIHSYVPLDYSFQFIPYLRYPGTIGSEKWDKKKIFKCLQGYHAFAQKNKVDIFVGEFGVNWRGGHYGEGRYLKDILDAFEQYKFHYTYWTYKAIKTYTFPDGIVQYLPNPPSVCRQGPVSGMETYITLWGKKKNDIINTWKTKNYTVNEGVLEVLQTYFQRNKK